MTETAITRPGHGDPLTAPFWEGAARHELLLQRCGACGRHQFYPRPFCVACESSDVAWVAAGGTGTVYASTTVRIAVLPELPPPYVVALVQLDEGPLLMTNLTGGACAIGARVRVAWRERDGLPPLPVFAPAAPGDAEGGA